MVAAADAVDAWNVIHNVDTECVWGILTEGGFYAKRCFDRSPHAGQEPYKPGWCGFLCPS